MALVPVTPSERGVQAARRRHQMQCPMNPGRSTIVRVKARDTAHFGRIDRSVERSPCARRSDRPKRRTVTLRASVSSDRSVEGREEGAIPRWSRNLEPISAAHRFIRFPRPSPRRRIWALSRHRPGSLQTPKWRLSPFGRASLPSATRRNSSTEAVELLPLAVVEPVPGGRAAGEGAGPLQGWGGSARTCAHALSRYRFSGAVLSPPGHPWRCRNNDRRGPAGAG